MQAASNRSRKNVPPVKPTSTATPDLSWVGFLPEEWRLVFARKLSAAVRKGNWPDLNQLLVNWKATAMAYADPELAADLAHPEIDDRGPVPSPSV